MRTLVYNGNWWSWKDNSQYWDKLPPSKGIIGRDVPYLKTVCWVDTNITAEKCIPLGFKYKLYLLHGLMTNNTMRNALILKVCLQKPTEETYTMIYKSEYVTPEMALKMKPYEKIVKTYVTDIDLDIFLSSDTEKFASV